MPKTSHVSGVRVLSSLFYWEEPPVGTITDRRHHIVFRICEQKFHLLVLRNVEQVGSSAGVKCFCRISSGWEFQPSMESCDYLDIIRLLFGRQYAMANKELNQHQSAIRLEHPCSQRLLHLLYA